LLENVPTWIGQVSVAVEVAGVAIIIFGLVLAAFEFLRDFVKRQHRLNSYDLLRVRIGKTLLLGLEILVAADVIRTIVLDLTLVNLITLGVLIVIRTLLSWTLVVEIENRWPWEKKG
jgi:uncharacterized membrane protein